MLYDVDEHMENRKRTMRKKRIQERRKQDKEVGQLRLGLFE